jgi:tRNA-specific 2-thiouridylase
MVKKWRLWQEYATDNLCKQLLYINLKTECMSFREPQSAITEGQFVAWYIEDELVGSGVIS